MKSGVISRINYIRLLLLLSTPKLMKNLWCINDLSDYLKFVFKAWDDEHEEEPDLLSYNMVYSEVCRRADEECFPPDEWAEDKYWWSFRHPLDNEVKRLREKVDYDDARNKKWNKKSGPHNSEGPILLVTK